MSRAASVAASGITGRSGSVDSAGELRMYPCPYTSCRRPFRRLEHLRRHVRTHTQEKPFWCTRCPKKFARQDNLTNHLRVHDKHEGSGAEGDVSAEYDMDASEYEEEEGRNVEMVPREWSATPAQDMRYVFLLETLKQTEEMTDMQSECQWKQCRWISRLQSSFYAAAQVPTQLCHVQPDPSARCRAGTCRTWRVCALSARWCITVSYRSRYGRTHGLSAPSVRYSIRASHLVQPRLLSACHCRLLVE